MEAKREQALVGLFVLIATGVLVATVFALSGAFSRAGATYRAYFHFAGGLEPGAAVRYGGMKAGRVEALRVDPGDSTRIEIQFTARPDFPVKTDSVVKISSLSALGDNYLEITTGSPTAPLAKDGTVLKSEEFVSFADLTAKLSQMSPEAQKLLENLNQRVTELRETVARVNDLLNEQNRANVAAAISNTRGMLEENRAKLKSTMSHVEETSAKLPALVDDFKKTADRADKTLADIQAVLGENRPDVRKAVVELRETLAAASKMVDQVDRTLLYNAENIDEMLENMRVTTENLKQFTDVIKSRPYTLIRSTSQPERKPGEPTKPQ